MSIGRHRLSGTSFATLARGHGDAAAMTTLAKAQLSRRSLLLRAVLEESRTWPEEEFAAGLWPAVDLLDHVQREAPAAGRSVFGYPLVGSWVARCLRQIRRRARFRTNLHARVGPALVDPKEASDEPLWVELAHLAAVAAAAAIRAGLTFEIAVPVRSGTVSLPTLGQARLPTGATYGVATVGGDKRGYRVDGANGSVVVPADPERDDEGWWGVRAISPARRVGPLDIRFDDVDPYRGGHGLAVAPRLDDETFARWAAQCDEALDRLATDHPHRLDELVGWPIVIVPLRATLANAGANATVRDAVGAMALTPPPSATALAHSIVHEFQHSKLGALLDLVDLYDRTHTRRYYSPWRSDPRPLSGLLQGVYAFLAIAEAWSDYRGAPPDLTDRHVRYEFARTRSQVAEALATAVASQGLTAMGRRFAAILRGRVDELLAVPVPGDLQRLADLANDDHRLTWRIRNVRVDAADVGRFVDAWRHGCSRPSDRPAAEVVTGGALYTEEPRHELVRHLVAGQTVALRPSDAALIAGDLATAAAIFRSEISSEPGRTDAWTGLAAARIRTAEPALARVYAEELPTLVAMYRHLSDGLDPENLARWLCD